MRDLFHVDVIIVPWENRGTVDAFACPMIRETCNMLTWIRRQIRYNQHERDIWITKIAERVPSKAKILDAGAGPGPYRRLFQHCQYYAQDFGQEPSTLGKYTNLNYVSDICSIPVPDRSFDAILCSEVLEHLPEPILAIKEFSRILKDGGLLILTAPLCSQLHQEPYHFYGGFTPHWYKKFLPQYGFTIESIEPNRRFFSYFAQEAARFSVLLSPKRTFSRSFYIGILCTPLWLVTFPLFRILLPILGRYLDRLNIEAIMTAGYHVVAIRGL